MFLSGKSPQTWVGMDAYLSLVCFNTAEGKKGNKPVPTSWADLIKPEYKDSIVMPNPASSGTGYLTIAAWLQIMGEEAGWKYMDALHQNIAQYIHSGSAPCVQAAKGERLIGIGLDTRGASEKTKGAPLELVIPKEGLGWELEVTAIVKGTKNLDAAKKLADWAASKKANELYAKTYPIVAYPGVDALLRELKGLGAHNVTRDRPRHLTGKGVFRKMLAAYEESAAAGGGVGTPAARGRSPRCWGRQAGYRQGRRCLF